MKRFSCKKLLAALLSVLLTLGTLAALPITVSADTPSAAWDGETTTKPNGSGTTADPYLVGTGAELAWLSANVGTLIAIDGNVNIKLTADIDLADKEFTPISLRSGMADAYSYKGVVFDGNGKTVSGLTVTAQPAAALFSYVGAGSSFKNVSLVGATIQSSDIGTGAILIAEARGNLTLEGVQTDATSVVNARKAGGIMALFVNSNATATVTKCVNRATVIGTSKNGESPRAAGIITEVEKNNSLVMSYCVNEGAITLNVAEKNNCNIGGLVAGVLYAGSVDAPTTARFTDCYNVGTLSTTTTGGTDISLGGILGRAQAGTMWFTRVYDYSVRNVQGGKSTAIIGHGAKTECVKHYTDMYACNHPDTTTPYEVIHGITDGDATRQFYTNVDRNANSPNIKTSLLQTIVLQDGTTKKNSTMLDEMTMIAEMAGTTPPTVETAAGDSLPRDYSWYASADGTLVTDKGTETAPYEFSTPAQWAAFSALSNGTHDTTQIAISADPVDFGGKYFKLTADIDLTGYVCAPACMNTPSGKIVLDGAGHTISNLKQEKISAGGLFASLADGSEIKNLNLKGFEINSAGVAAGFVSNVMGGMSFHNCTIKESTLNGKGTSGAFVASGVSNNPANKWFFTACVNEADVTVDAASQSMVGGLIGNISAISGVELTLSYCINRGDISLSSPSTNAAVGGLIGRVAYSAQPIDGVILLADNCYNTGKLSVVAKADNISLNTAGFIGWGFFGGELYLQWFYDYSARANDTKGANAGAIGNCANVELIKILDECFGMNAEDSEAVYSAMYGATRNASTLKDNTSMLVESMDAELMMNGAPSTLDAELARIDAVLASVDPVTGDFDDPTEDLEKPAPTPSTPSTSTPSNEETDKEEDKKDDATTTKAADDETDAPAEEGCGSSVSATFAVLALTAACGMAIVGKKKED